MWELQPARNDQFVEGLAWWVKKFELRPIGNRMGHLILGENEPASLSKSLRNWYFLKRTSRSGVVGDTQTMLGWEARRLGGWEAEPWEGQFGTGQAGWQRLCSHLPPGLWAALPFQEAFPKVSRQRLKGIKLPQPPSSSSRLASVPLGKMFISMPPHAHSKSPLAVPSPSTSRSPLCAPEVIYVGHIL